MASSHSKTLAVEILQPAKRLRSLSPSLECRSPRLHCLSDPSPADCATAEPNQDSPVIITDEQRSKIEFNKYLARSKRNANLCTERAKGQGIDCVKLEELLVEETWMEALSGEFQKPYAMNLSRFVESELRGDVPVYPPPHLIFNALNSTPFDRVKVVIIGQDPYHGPGQAMGLAFSVPNGIKPPSSLVNIFKELNKDGGYTIPLHGNLERWAIQGVLLLNSVLTVRKHQANSHARKGWESFTDAIIQAISQKKAGVVFILWGNLAQAKSRLVDGTKHHILKAAHPSGLSANRGFFGCRNLRIVLRQERKLYVLEEEAPKEPIGNARRTDKDAYKKYQDDTLDVECLMLATMFSEFQKQHESMRGYEIIKHLKKMFEGQARQERFDISKTLFLCKMGARDSVGTHVLKMIGYIENFERLNFPLGQELATDLILQSLSDSYEQFVLNYNMNEIDKALPELLAC